MSPNENTIVLEPIEIAGEGIPVNPDTPDIDPQHSDTLRQYIHDGSGGKAVNICL